MFEKTKALCDYFLEMGVPGFDLNVWKDGKCILRYWNGYSDAENRIPMRGDELYNIYSCSKPITCTAALQLWEKGLYSLEDPLYKYMPEFREMTVRTEDGVRKTENPILIRHLFEMTAGFSYDGNSPMLQRAKAETQGRCQTRELMRYLAQEPLLFEPGAQWRYSLCHDVLAALVEVLSGQRFEDYVKEHIFDPLGMTRSTFMLPDSDLGKIAAQYSFVQGKRMRLGPEIWGYKFGSEYASGGAGCISTVDDYIRFTEALRAGETLLKRDTVRLMATGRLSEAQNATYNKAATHGYGLGVRTPKQPFTDFGWGGAAGAYLAIDIPHGISIYHAQHMLHSPNHDLRNLVYEYVMAEYFGLPAFKKRINDKELPDNCKFTD